MLRFTTASAGSRRDPLGGWEIRSKAVFRLSADLDSSHSRRFPQPGGMELQPASNLLYLNNDYWNLALNTNAGWEETTFLSPMMPKLPGNTSLHHGLLDPEQHDSRHWSTALGIFRPAAVSASQRKR